MKEGRKMIKAFIVFGILTLIVPGFAAAQKSKNSISVNCDTGQSVQNALNRVNGPSTIVVTGTCNQNIVIKKDDVTLQGGIYVGPDPNQNTISVPGARRVSIKGATVGGARNGIVAYQGGSLTIENCNIQNNARVGIISIYGSSVNVNSSTIQNNGLQGVIASDNSALILTNSTIKSNSGSGVLAIRSSSARIGQNLSGDPGPNVINSNGGSGVGVSRSSHALIDGNTIQSNSSSGVSIEGASATVTNNIIRANQGKGISVFSSGNARIGVTDGDQPQGNTIESNVYDGIQISNSANAYMLANTIRSNGSGTGRAGVGIYRATGRLLGGNLIEANAGSGVEMSQGVLLQGVGDWDVTPVRDVIQNNSSSGIAAFEGSTIDIQYSTISNNTQHGIVLSTRSTLRIYGSTVSGNIMNGIGVLYGSAVVFFYPTGSLPASVTGNTGWGVSCGDNESSYAGDTSGVIGNTGGQVSCTGF
jgi:parallel beta-helix repeat protein